jgi:hypothetical protein
MATTPRLSNKTLKGVISTGNGSTRLDAQEAAEMAQEALLLAKQAVDATAGIKNDTATLSKVVALETKLKKINSDISGLKQQDIQHTADIQEIKNGTNIPPELGQSDFTITFVDNISSDDLWKESN